MALFDNFPFTNFHDLNLDWLLKIVKDDKDAIDELPDTVKNEVTAQLTTAGLSEIVKEQVDEYASDFTAQVDFRLIVTNYGADATGHSDSAAAFSACVTDARNKNVKCVIVPCGTYLISGPVDLSDITLIGLGENKSIIKPTSDSIIFTMGAHSSINNIQFDCGNHECTCVFVNKVPDNYYADIDNCLFVNCKGTCIDNLDSEIRVNKCAILLCKTGILNRTSASGKVINNIYTNNFIWAQTPIEVSVTAVTYEGAIITNNIIFPISGSDECTGIIIRHGVGNLIANNVIDQLVNGQCISVNSSRNTVISNNYIGRQYGQTAAKYGIIINSSKNTNINSCHFAGLTEAGIYIVNSSKLINIINNFFIEDDMCLRGVNVDSGEYINIKNNIMYATALLTGTVINTFKGCIRDNFVSYDIGTGFAAVTDNNIVIE